MIEYIIAASLGSIAVILYSMHQRNVWNDRVKREGLDNHRK